MARRKIKNGSIISVNLSDIQIKLLDQLSMISKQNRSTCIGLLVERAHNMLYNWGQTDEIMKGIQQCEVEIATIQERKKCLNEKLDVAIDISKTQNEWKERLENNYKQEKDRLVKVLSERIVMKVEERHIMRFAAEFSALLENKWTKEELAAQALIMAKNYTENDIIKIRKDNQI